MKKVFTYVDKAFEWASAIILALMMILMGLQVFFRYVMDAPLAWTEELARFAFIWLTFIAGYIAARKGEHVAISAVQERLPNIPSKIIKVVSNLVSAAFFFIVAYYSVSQWGKLGSQTSSAIGIPMNLVYLGMIIGSFFMTLAYGVSAVSAAREKK